MIILIVDMRQMNENSKVNYREKQNLSSFKSKYHSAVTLATNKLIAAEHNAIRSIVVRYCWMHSASTIRIKGPCKFITVLHYLMINEDLSGNRDHAIGKFHPWKCDVFFWIRNPEHEAEITGNSITAWIENMLQARATPMLSIVFPKLL